MNKKDNIPILVNQNRNKNPLKVEHYQPEYERLQVTPVKMSPGINKDAFDFNPQVKQTQPTNKVNNPVASRRGVVRNNFPKQQKISIGNHNDQMWTGVDSENIGDEENIEELPGKMIDNNDLVDTNSYQSKSIPDEEEVIETDLIENDDKFEPEKERYDENCYTLLVLGKMVGTNLTLYEVESLVDEIFFNPKAQDLSINDFAVYKRVQVKIGVHIKE